MHQTYGMNTRKFTLLCLLEYFTGFGAYFRDTGKMKKYNKHIYGTVEIAGGIEK